jgi:hypothetical protein
MPSISAVSDLRSQQENTPPKSPGKVPCEVCKHGGANGRSNNGPNGKSNGETNGPSKPLPTGSVSPDQD